MLIRRVLLLLMLIHIRVWCIAQNFSDEKSVSGDSDVKIDSEIAPDIIPDTFFLNKIFNKYGDENVINFEGLEHLLDNLGLGGGVFTSPHDLGMHKINGTFRILHDPTHRHKRHSQSDAETEVKKCLSPSDLIELYHLDKSPSDVTINRNTFLSLCPALVYQLDQKSCYNREPLEAKMSDRYTNWMYASLSVLLISAVGLLGVAIMPLANSNIFQEMLHFLVALAIGTLCGDAMLHLLPHALSHHSVSHPETHGEEHTDPVLKCGVVLLTILLFYSVESLVRIFSGNTGKHNHSHNRPKRDSMLKEEVDEIEIHAMLTYAPKKKKNKPITPVALMVILGDVLHNLTDGLAIGAAFSSDPVTGFATALAVFCHELPHELGDFAVMIRSGMSIRRALCFNILSSIVSFLGMVLGLWSAEHHASASQWIYAGTAGTFLYISLADLIPEITGNGTPRFVDFFLSFIGIVCGGLIMLSIALYEDKLRYLFN